MVDDYMINKVSDKFNEIISTEKFHDTKILINKDDKLSDDIILEGVVILMTSVLKWQ